MENISDINLQDGLTLEDTKSFSSKSPKCLYNTDVICTNELGEVLFRKSNIITMSGRRFTLEKLFNINNQSKLTLNEILNINPIQENLTSGPRKEQFICLFGVGNGGSGTTFGSVYSPASIESNLYGLLPMRFVDKATDLDMETRQKYYMKKEMPGDKYAYFLKRFEQDPVIYLKQGDGTFVPSDDFNKPSSSSSNIALESAEAYIEINLKVNSDDVREYLEWQQEESDNNIFGINELGLYFGFQEGVGLEWSDYLGVELFSKLCFNTEALDDESKELNIIYRIYI